jgi:hypothetical protein
MPTGGVNPGSTGFTVLAFCMADGEAGEVTVPNVSTRLLYLVR